MDLGQQLIEFLQPEIKIHVLPGGRMPELGSDGASGFDVFARNIQDDERRDPRNENLRLPLWDFAQRTIYELKSKKSVLVGIGVAFEMPPYVGCLIIARSGQTSKKNRPIEIVNSPSWIDPDFRGEAGIRVKNISRRIFRIEHGMKLAQAIFIPTITPRFIPVGSLQELSPTRRSGDGLGSSGMFAREPSAKIS